MRSSSRAFRYFCVPSLLLCLALVALAKDGRDFAGFYALSNVSEQGDKVEFTMTVQVSNYSDFGDIKSPVIALLVPGSSSPDNRELRDLQEFNAVKLLPAKHDVTVSGKFAVSKTEFESWSKRGGSPKVVVIYEDSGRTLRQHVQLSRRSILPPVTAE
jgi:hypothetical protein